MPAEFSDVEVADLSLAEFGRKEITLAEHEMPGLMAVGDATGHPSSVMSHSSADRTPAQKVARLHLDALGVKLTTLRPEQAEYIGVQVEGPYMPDRHRY